MATYQELKAQAEKLMQQAEEMRTAERADALKDVQQKIATYDLSAQELGFAFGPSRKSAGAKRSAGTRPAVAAKFKGPNGESWSGRGRQPKWIVSALAAGKKMEDFRV